MVWNLPRREDGSRVTLSCGKKNRARVQENQERARLERGRKASVRAQPGGHPGRALGAARKLSPLARLVHALGEEKIRFQVAGMSAAILKGVSATTLDTDFWIDHRKVYLRASGKHGLVLQDKLNFQPY